MMLIRRAASMPSRRVIRNAAPMLPPSWSPLRDTLGIYSSVANATAKVGLGSSPDPQVVGQVGSEADLLPGHLERQGPVGGHRQHADPGPRHQPGFLEVAHH